jgi:hypothetical protein
LWSVGSTDDRAVFLGPDKERTMLKVMAVETEAGYLVIHAAPTRRKHLDYLPRRK